MKKVGIIGLGWIGLPLAYHLKNKGWEVIGSTTSDQKKSDIEKEGIEVVKLTMNPHPEGDGFQKLFDCEYLVINIPPRSRIQSADFYLEQLKYLKSMIHQSVPKKVLFTSSTGIYPSEPSAISYDESFVLTRENAGNPTLWDAEQMMLKNKEYQMTIFRLGGLMGESRIPGKYFAGKEKVTGHTRVNYLHLEDAVSAITWILEKEIWEENFNVVAPIHPKREEIYEKNAMDLGLKAPKSYELPKEGEDRLISSKKIIEFGYNFKQPNPLEFPYNPK